MKARIIVDNLRRYYIHTISLEGVQENETSYSLVHPTAYYTLNNIPEGAKLSMTEVSTKNSGKNVKTNVSSKKGISADAAKPNADAGVAATKTFSSKTIVAAKAPIYNDVRI